MKKDTIYIDIEDEITAIIDKVRSSEQKIVALVLPKRASVLHSVVNMRLLKRTADNAKKKVVLITSEASLLPLAGMVGLYTARNLQSKPELPTPPPSVDDQELTIAEGAEEVPLDQKKSVGELAGAGAIAGAARAAAQDDETETIELDAAKPDPASLKPGKPDLPKKDKKLQVPNFNRFRVKFFLVILALFVIIGGWIFGFLVLPKAAVTIQADITEIPFARDFIVSPTTKEFSVEKGIVPAEKKEVKKSESEKYAATGEEDKGTKATGTVTIINCTDVAVSIPAGTGVSSGDLTFLTDDTVYVPPSNFFGSGACKNDGKNDVEVTAMAAGDKYNLSARNYSVAGQGTTITGSGTVMAGGTTKIAKVVSAADFDAAKQKLLARDTATAKKELAAELSAAGLHPIEDTFTSSPGNVTTAPKVNEEAAESTASVEYTYTMLGVKQEQLKEVIEAGVKDKYDANVQKIYKDGTANMRLKTEPPAKNGDIATEMITTVSAGPKIDEEAIKKEVAGKKSGEAKALLEQRPGVKEASVKYSPFWVFQAPKKTAKISVTFNVPETTTSGEQSD